MTYDEIFDYFREHNIYIDCHELEDRRAIIDYLKELNPTGDYQYVADRYSSQQWPYMTTSFVSRNWVLYGGSNEPTWSVNDFWDFVRPSDATFELERPDLEAVL